MTIREIVAGDTRATRIDAHITWTRSNIAVFG